MLAKATVQTKVDPDRRLRVDVKAVGNKSEHDVRLTHPGIAEEDDLE